MPPKILIRIELYNGIVRFLYHRKAFLYVYTSVTVQNADITHSTLIFTAVTQPIGVILPDVLVIPGFTLWNQISSLTTLVSIQSALMPQYVVCPSVCLSVTFRYHYHIGWNTSKITSRPKSLR